MSRSKLLLLCAALVACAKAEPIEDTLTDDAGTMMTADAGACTSMCNGQCADLKTDNANCGKCGVACPMGATCVQGSCQCASGSTKCGAACVDLKTDNANCGKCGATCGGPDAGVIMGGGTWTCANGACAIACPMPKKECSGACVDTQSDIDHCGMCDNACDAMTQECTSGTCCAKGQKVCGGMCTDVQFDAKNCGMCGNACPMNAPYCNKGMCTQCDNSVLLLADGNGGPNGTFQTKANQAGLAVNLVNNGVAQYSGNPAASSYAVTVVMVGDAYSTDMPAQGQQAIVNAQGSGRGVVITDWGGYHVSSNRWATLKSVNLFTYTTGSTAQLTFTLTQNNHPIWSGLPNSFTTSATMGVSGGTITNSGTAIATVSGGVNGPGVIVRSSPGGRIVYLTHAAAYSSASGWVNDTNTVNLTINAIKWATGCLL